MLTKRPVVTRNPVLRAIVYVMPLGVRRLILLSSLIAYVVNTKEPDKAFVQNLDKALRLSRSSDQSLEFPIRLSKVFWGNRELFQHEIEILTDTRRSSIEKEVAALKLAALVPNWFAYTQPHDPKVIAKDLAKYFTYFHSPQLG